MCKTFVKVILWEILIVKVSVILSVKLLSVLTITHKRVSKYILINGKIYTTIMTSLKNVNSLRQLVFRYLRDHPIADNPELYKAFPGESESTIRDYKKQYLEEVKKEFDKMDLDIVGRDNTNILQDQNEKIYTKIDSETIESVILKLLNAGKIDSRLVRDMIAFYTIKGDTEGLEQEIDMEGFLKISEDIKKEAEREAEEYYSKKDSDKIEKEY